MPYPTDVMHLNSYNFSQSMYVIFEGYMRLTPQKLNDFRLDKNWGVANKGYLLEA